MTRLFGRTLLILATAAVFWLSSAATPPRAYATDTGTPAEQNLETLDSSGTMITCSQVEEAKGGVLLGYIVPCLAKTIENTTQRMSAAMITLLTPVINSFIFLAIILYGVRILQGGGPVHVEGILLLLKITLAMLILNIMPGTLVPALYGIMNESQAIVESTVSGVADLKCPVNQYANADTPQVWSEMDCLLGKLYGFTMGDQTDANGRKRPNMLLTSSVFGLLGGFFFGGTLGAILFFSCIGMLWTMFWVVLRTAFTFINAYLYAAILLILSPLFVPLVMMRATTGYFDAWWRGILGSILLPILITAYAMFAMLLYDQMLFSPNALINNLFNNDLMQKVEQASAPVCDVSRTGNPAQRVADTGAADEKTYYGGLDPFMKNFMNPLLTAANNQCAGLMKPSVNVMNILNDTTPNASGKTPKQVFTKLFYDATELLVLALLIAGGLVDVTSFARRLVGSSVSTTIDTRSQVETKFAQMQASARGAVMQTMGTARPDGLGNYSTSGLSFIKNLAETPKSIISSVGGTMGRN